MSNYYGPKIVTDGLVLCLDAASSKSYPGSGTILTDLSGNNNNGTLINGAVYNTLNRGSIIFDGTDDKIDCGSASLSNLTSLSLMLWIKKTNNSSAGNGFDRLISKRSSGGTGWWDFYTGTSHEISFAVDYTTTDLIRTSSNVLVLNRWSMVTCTWTGASDASSIKLYINNSETSIQFNQNGVGGRPSENSNITTIGNADFGNRPFYGNIASALAYNRVLSASEISQNYNATKGRFGL